MNDTVNLQMESTPRLAERRADGAPSMTATFAAQLRAAHQLLDGGRIFRDELALKVLDDDARKAVESARPDASTTRMRMFIAARTRLAEEALHAAIERGVRQLVILGAGLDTYAYRGERRDRLQTILEVDHPATQAWKRRRLAEAGISAPPQLRFVPVDFERQTLEAALADAGFDRRQRTFFTWLGVVPYLTEPAIWSTLRSIAKVEGGAHVVFDYANPPASMEPHARAMHDRHADRVRAVGETWVSYFESERLHAALRATGFVEIHDLGPREIAEHFFPQRVAAAPTSGGHILHACT